MVQFHRKFESRGNKILRGAIHITKFITFSVISYLTLLLGDVIMRLFSIMSSPANSLHLDYNYYTVSGSPGNVWPCVQLVPGLLPAVAHSFVERHM